MWKLDLKVKYIHLYTHFIYIYIYIYMCLYVYLHIHIYVYRNSYVNLGRENMEHDCNSELSEGLLESRIGKENDRE
jgi:hypothetical protein